MASLESIQRQLGPDSGIKPGSPEERALLEQARAIKKDDTDEFAAVRTDALEAVAGPEGIVPPEGAQHAAQVALEHVTGEHEIVKLPPPETRHAA